MNIREQRRQQQTKITYLSSIVRLTNLIDLMPRVVVFFTRDDSVHASRLSFEYCSGMVVSSSSFNLDRAIKKKKIHGEGTDKVKR